MACRAEARTGFGKTDCPGSQGGLRKRGLWWKCEPTSRIERAGMETLHLKSCAPYFYPDGAADKAAIQLVGVQPCQLPMSDT